LNDRQRYVARLLAPPTEDDEMTSG